MADGRTIIVSENRLFRDGMRQMLEKTQFSVIGEGWPLPDLPQLAGPEIQPDLVIFHLGSAQDDAPPLDAMRDLWARFPQAKIVVLADQSAKPALPALLRAEVSAILFTHISSEMLQRSLELVLSDHRLFPAEIMSPSTGDSFGATPHNGDGFDGHPPALPAGENPAGGDTTDLPPLSPRECEVVQCLADGLSNKTIARKLHITEGTVKVHVKGLLRKLRAANRTQLAIWALRHTDAAGGEMGAQQPSHRHRVA